MKRGEETGRGEKKSARREERKEKSPPPPVTHARVLESKGERRRHERDRGNRGREEREERKRGRERENKERENEEVRGQNVVPQSGHRKKAVPQSGPKMKGHATKRCLPFKIRQKGVFSRGTHVDATWRARPRGSATRAHAAPTRRDATHYLSLHI